jgi:hypothetical protein
MNGDLFRPAVVQPPLFCRVYSKLGYSVTGTVHPDRVLANSGAKPEKRRETVSTTSGRIDGAWDIPSFTNKAYALRPAWWRRAVKWWSAPGSIGRACIGKGANAIIALRCSKLSGRFEGFWERRSEPKQAAA